MSWTAPRTWVTGEVVTAALLNTHLRDMAMDLDRRTSPVTAAVLTLESTASAAFTDLATAGPAVTATIGATNKALLSMMCRQYNSSAGESTLMAPAISGATTYAAADALALSFTSPTGGGEVRHGMTIPYTALNPGATTATLKYRRTNGTGSFSERIITLQPLGS